MSRCLRNCARDNLRGQKSLGPLKMSLEMAQKVIVPQKKIRSQSFLNSGTLVILCTRVLLCTVVVCCCLLLGVLVCCCVLLRFRGVWDTQSIRCLDSSLGRVPTCDTLWIQALWTIRVFSGPRPPTALPFSAVLLLKCSALPCDISRQVDGP